MKLRTIIIANSAWYRLTTIKGYVGANVVVQQTELLPVMLACHMGTGLGSGCSNSYGAANGLGKAAQDGSCTWAPTTHVGDLQ